MSERGSLAFGPGDFQLVDQGGYSSTRLLKLLDNGGHLAIDEVYLGVDFFHSREGGFFCCREGLVDFLELAGVPDSGFRLSLLADGFRQKPGILLLKPRLVTFPGAEPVEFVIERPDKRNHQRKSGDQINSAE